MLKNAKPVFIAGPPGPVATSTTFASGSILPFTRTAS